MITIEINETDVSRALERISRALTNLTPVMQDIGEDLVHSTKQRFLAGEAPDGSPWAPKSQTTLDAYAARKDPVDPRPLIGPSRRLSSEIHYRASSDSVEWGSSLIYAGTMHFGAEQGAFGAFMGKDQRGRDHFHHIPWGDIPARPFLGLSEDDRAGIVDTVSDWLERIAAGD